MLSRIINHMHWANSAILDWLENNQNASGELHRLACHILNVEAVWIRRVQESDYDRDTFRIHGIAKLREINAENLRAYTALLESDVKKEIDYRLIEGTPGRSSIENIIVHVFSHGFHHSGQMAAMVSKSGKKFPNISYIQYTRTGSQK